MLKSPTEVRRKIKVESSNGSKERMKELVNNVVTMSMWIERKRNQWKRNFNVYVKRERYELATLEKKTINVSVNKRYARFI